MIRTAIRVVLIHVRAVQAGRRCGGRRRQQGIEFGRLPHEFFRFRRRALICRAAIEGVAASLRARCGNNLRCCCVGYVHRSDGRRRCRLRRLYRLSLLHKRCARGWRGSRRGRRWRSGRDCLRGDGHILRGCARRRRADAAFRHMVFADARSGGGRARALVHACCGFGRCAAVRLKHHEVGGQCRAEHEPGENHQYLSGGHHTY